MQSYSIESQNVVINEMIIYRVCSRWSVHHSCLHNIKRHSYQRGNTTLNTHTHTHTHTCTHAYLYLNAANQAQNSCKKNLRPVLSIINVHIQQVTGCSGLAITCLTVVWEVQGSNPTTGSCRCFATTIYSLGHGLHTLTALPRWTQPSTLRGMVKWVSAFGLSNNNKWRWWVWLLAAYRRTTARVVWPGLRVGSHLALFHTHHMNRVTLEVALSHDDSTINIIILVIIIVIIKKVRTRHKASSTMSPSDDLNPWPFDPKPNQFIFVRRCTKDKFGTNPSTYTGDITETTLEMVF